MQQSFSQQCNGEIANRVKMKKISDSEFKKLIAKEANVRIEMLDFYMAKFERKNMLEMRGIDTSGIDDDITDVYEWLRYCNWVIEQSTQLMTSQERSELIETLGLKLQLDRLLERGVTKVLSDTHSKIHISKNCHKIYGSNQDYFGLADFINSLKSGKNYNYCPYCVDEEIYEIFNSYNDTTK